MTAVAPFKRKFMPADLAIVSWDDLKPLADALEARALENVADLEKFLIDWSEFEIVVSGDYWWRMVGTTRDTSDDAIKKSYDDFLEQVQPEMSKWSNRMRRRVLGCKAADDVMQEGFALLLKRWRADTELFREENIPIQTEDGMKCLKAGQIKGAMSVEIDGKTLTMPEAGAKLESADRGLRERVWRAMRTRMLQDKGAMDENMAELVALRNKIAVNAGLKNFRDYKFKQLQRFDYTPQDCFAFHDAIEKEVMPLVADIQRKQIKAMGVDKLRPWDASADAENRPALRAFETADELIQKGTIALSKIDPIFAETIDVMKTKDCLDLASRPNKAPGAYNLGLHEAQTSFMFGNVTGTVDDTVTFMHEAGHAVHNTLTFQLPLVFYKDETCVPMEVAELASMSMELLSFDHWHHFFPVEADCRRAKYDHLKRIVEFFPHMARIDAFQHALYEHPEMSIAERHETFGNLLTRFGTGLIDWSGIEEFRSAGWHSQGHIFEMPFYYVEYGIAQLGAIQIWRNYKRDPKKALEQYKTALGLGGTRTLPELYKAAGIKFDFSREMLKELMDFVRKEMDALA